MNAMIRCATWCITSAAVLGGCAANPAIPAQWIDVPGESVRRTVVFSWSNGDKGDMIAFIRDRDRRGNADVDGMVFHIAADYHEGIAVPATVSRVSNGYELELHPVNRPAMRMTVELPQQWESEAFCIGNITGSTGGRPIYVSIGRMSY